MTRSTLLNLLFPAKCAFCGRVSARDVCEACEDTLPRTEPPLREGTGYGKCAVPLRYEGQVREALLRFKFHGVRGAAAGFGRLLAQCVAEELGGTFDAVTYAPVSAERRAARGYDQAYLLARNTARHWDIEPLTLLRKTRDNPPQSGLDAAARRGNVVGVYEPLEVEKIKGTRVLLIDDILTTGSTLSECARVLRDAGAAAVVCACLAAATVGADQTR